MSVPRTAIEMTQENGTVTWYAWTLTKTLGVRGGPTGVVGSGSATSLVAAEMDALQLQQL